MLQFKYYLSAAESWEGNVLHVFDVVGVSTEQFGLWCDVGGFSEQIKFVFDGVGFNGTV